MQPCPAAWLQQHTHTHTHARTFSPSRCLALNFCLDSLSALTTDGVLIKSSRNITVSKQCSACQFHNCWVLIQPLTCSIQVGREPTVLAPTGSSLLARSCGGLQQRASPRKVNCGSCHASWHRGWRTAAIWLVIKDDHWISQRWNGFLKNLAIRKKLPHIKLIIFLFIGTV